MFAEKPFIHLFKTAGAYYLFDVNRNTILRIKESLFSYLTNYLAGETDSSVTLKDEDVHIINKLKENGFLSSKKVKSIDHPNNDTLDDTLENKVQKITLQVTQQCNLRCAYCTYSGDYLNRQHSQERMTLETALRSIDFLKEHSRDAKNVNIGFYGGEPLLEFELVKKVIEYSKKVLEGKNVTFSITTNATLLDEIKVEYLQKQNIPLLISLDGPKEIHDSNRKFAGSEKGSYDVVIKNLLQLKEKYPEYFNSIGFSAVIDKKNDFKCTSEFFSGSEFFGGMTALMSFIDEDYRLNPLEQNNDFNQIWYYEIFKIFMNKLGRFDNQFVSPLLKYVYDDLKNLNAQLVSTEELPDRGHHSGPCVPGALRLFINATGKFYPCEKVSEASRDMCIGDIDNGFNMSNVRRLLNIGELTQESCKNCWAFNFCHLCARAADTTEGLSAKNKLSKCGTVKRMVEERMTNYCILKEFGHDFNLPANVLHEIV